jgi:hypothetical protein
MRESNSMSTQIPVISEVVVWLEKQLLTLGAGTGTVPIPVQYHIKNFNRVNKNTRPLYIL